MDSSYLNSKKGETRCANCFHAKVVKRKHSYKSKIIEKVRCAKGHWWNRVSEKCFTFGQVKWIKPASGYCPDYDPMGDDLEDFPDALPDDNLDFELLEGLRKTGGI